MLPSLLVYFTDKSIDDMVLYIIDTYATVAE